MRILMESNNTKISSLQLGIIIIVATIGTGILSLPRSIAEIADSDGWILILTGGVVAIIAVMIIFSLGNLFPQKNIIEYSKELVGKPFTIVIGMILSGYFILVSAFSLRIFGEVLKMFLLPRTPLEVISITFLVVVMYLIRNGIECMARFYEIMFFLMFIPFVLSMITGIHDGDYTNLLPVFQTSPGVLAKGTLETFFSFIGFEVALLFFPFVSDQKNIKKSLLISVGLIIFLYLTTSIIVIANFGVYETKNLVWPLMSYIKSIEVPGSFIEQLEGFIMTIWVLFIYTTLTNYFFAGVFIVKELVNAKDHKGFVILLMPIIYILSLLPDNVAQVYDWLGYFSLYGGITVIFIIPVFLLIIAKIRKKGGKAHG